MDPQDQICRILGSLTLLFCCFYCSGTNAASCFAASQALSPEVLNSEEAAIKSNVTNWLKGQGGNLAGRIRDITASDPDFAATVAAAATKATSEQAAAIGSGLGQAANACRADHPDEASMIQQAAAGSENQSFLTSFNSTTGNTQTTSVGAAGGAPGGGAAGGAGVGGATGATTGGGAGGGSGGTASTTTSGGTTNNFQSQGGAAFGSLSSLSPTTSTLTTTTTTVVGASSVSAF